jgi:hypothetical protein
MYSALACPYLKHPSARRRQYEPSQTVVTRGAAHILTFRHYGVVLFEDAQLPFQRDGAHNWGHFGCVELLTYNTWKDIFPLYDDAIAADAEFIDIATRLYWTDSPEDQERLKACVREDEEAIELNKSTSVYVDGWVGGHSYQLLVPPK